MRNLGYASNGASRLTRLTQGSNRAAKVHLERRRGADQRLVEVMLITGEGDKSWTQNVLEGDLSQWGSRVGRA